MRFRSSTILSMTALAILSSLPLAAQAATAPMGGLTLSLTGVPSGATKVLVELEQPITHISVPNRLDFYVLAILPGGGPSMTAVVPPSQLLRRTAAAQHDTINLMIVAESSTRGYPRFTSARYNPSGQTALSVGRFGDSSYRADFAKTSNSVGSPDVCIPKLKSHGERATRIGELHVATQGGVTGSFNSSIQADNSITVGFSTSGKNGTCSASGSINLSNSISSDGGFSRTDGFRRYVNGDIYYAKYAVTCPTGVAYYEAIATSSVGDAFPGARQPKRNPYGSCAHDPNGHAVVAARGGHWNEDRSHAVTYSGIATLWGFSFGGSNGYSTHVNEGWKDSGSDDTFVCGNKDPVTVSSVFYSGSE